MSQEFRVAGPTKSARSWVPLFGYAIETINYNCTSIRISEAVGRTFSEKFGRVLKNFANFTGKHLSFSFELFSVISKISFADFEHVFVCLERYW